MLFLTKVFVPESQVMSLGAIENSFFKAGTERNSKILVGYSKSKSLKLKASNQKLKFLFSDLDQQL